MLLKCEVPTILGRVVTLNCFTLDSYIINYDKYLKKKVLLYYS